MSRQMGRADMNSAGRTVAKPGWFWSIPPAEASFVHDRSALNKQLYADVEEFGEFLCLGFADASLAVKHFGSNTF